MAKELEKGRHISVLVEQAFPTCILVSYKDEDKTFRGVLLHEPNHSVTRASVSKIIGNNVSSSNYHQTTTKALKSSESCTNGSRVNTRSSTINSQDQGDIANLVTPVNKIRGIVKTLAPRKRRNTKPEDQDSSTKTLESSNIDTTTEEGQPLSPTHKMTLMTSLKRKRESSNLSSLPKKVKNEEGSSSESNSSPPYPQIYPVLTLRRTAGTTNNYVALLSEKNSNIDKETEAKSNNQTPETVQNNTSHKHNTRYKGKKRMSPCVESETKNKQEEILENGEPLVEVYTKRPSTPTSPRILEENTKSKHFNVNKAYAKRGVQPRNHNQEMRVGEIVWGKVHGHPWWPGRILGILCHASEHEAGYVKVAWYGSTTTSEISCSFLATFQENFKQLFKKQKHGAYRRAVREAQQDLQVMSVDGQVFPA